MSKANYQPAADVFHNWRDDVLTGHPPTLYPVGSNELLRIEIGPQRVTLFGGAPGAGKTALTMQFTFDGLRLNQTLRALVCNVEMPPAALLDRQLARLSGIDLDDIRHRRLTHKHADRLDQAMNTLEPLMDRLCFLRAPFGLENVAATADDFSAGLLVLDYIQRILPPGAHRDRRGSVDATMDYLRRFADAGVAVLVVAAVARTKDSKGRSSYDGAGLNLASFRESSELEFGADDAFILVPDSKAADVVTLRHLKARHTEPQDLLLKFDGRLQRFTPMPTANIQPKQQSGNLQAAMAELWAQTTPASEDDGGDLE
jgi:replicative DNA helicase